MATNAPTACTEPSKLTVPHPKKMEIVLDHRRFCKMTREATQKNELQEGSPRSPSFNREIPPGLQPILIRQINDKTECVYRERVLHLTLIEDPIFGILSINVAGEDAEGDVIPVAIYGMPQTKSSINELKFGTQLAILNPFHRVAMGRKRGIRVEKPEHIVHLGWKDKMCRYRGEENAQRMCSKCKVNYCSRDCQLADWKYFSHKMICE